LPDQRGASFFRQDKLRLDERRFRSPFSSTDRNGAALLALNDELAAEQADAVGRTGRKGEAALAALATARAEASNLRASWTSQTRPPNWAGLSYPVGNLRLS